MLIGFENLPHHKVSASSNVMGYFHRTSSYVGGYLHRTLLFIIWYDRGWYVGGGSIGGGWVAVRTPIVLYIPCVRMSIDGGTAKKGT